MQQIVLHETDKSYGDNHVLQKLSLQFEAGHIYALMGPSGSGKTTLLRLLAGLEQPDSGSIEGVREDSVSFMFQEDRLLEYLDAPSNVLFTSPGKERGMIERKLAELGIDPRDHHRPVSEFSGGMKRRVALLRTLISDRELLLLDEPFKGLDEATVQAAAGQLLALRNGRTVIMSTHSREEAKLCGAEIVALLPGQQNGLRFTSVQEAENTLY